MSIINGSDHNLIIINNYDKLTDNPLNDVIFKASIILDLIKRSSPAFLESTQVIVFSDT